jgi:hypothetical protein
MASRRPAAAVTALLLAATCGLAFPASAHLPQPAAQPAAQAPSKRVITSASSVPAGMPVLIQLRDADQRLAMLRSMISDYGAGISGVMETIENNPQITQFRVGLAGLAAVAGTDSWAAMGAIIGQETTIALRPREGDESDLVAASVPRDPATLTKFLDAVHKAAGFTNNGKPDAARTYESLGVRVYKFDERLHQAYAGGTLLIASGRELMESAIAAQRESRGAIANSALFTRATALAPSDAFAWMAIDAKSLRPAGAGEDLRVSNPGAGFLFGGWYRHVMSSESAVAWMTTVGRTMTLRMRTDGAAAMPDFASGLVAATEPVKQWDSRRLPAFLGEVSVQRGWASLFAEREQLLTAEGATQAAEFASTLTTLLGGAAFIDDVLPAVAGPMRLVSVEHNPKDRGFDVTPVVPQFALSIPLKFDATSDVARRLESASQGALSLISLDSMQKGGPAMRLDIDKHEGVRIVLAEFEPPKAGSAMKLDPAGERAQRRQLGGVRYNFAPAAAIVPVGEGRCEYVVGSTADLVRSIITRIRSTDPLADGGPADTIELRGSSVTRLLEVNRSELATQQMLENGLEEDEATRRIDALLGLSALVDSLTARSLVRASDGEAEVRLTLREPAKADAGAAR